LDQSTSQKTSEGILYTDFYELTMAQLYYRMGIHEKPVLFDYFFRNYPDYGTHKAGYCINAGLESLWEWMKSARFGYKEIGLLEGHKGKSGKPIFEKDFLTWLNKNGHYEVISIRAIPEGRVVHSNVPIAQIQGPFAMAQILETSFLNHLNYQTLVATKASRIRQAGCKNLTIDFGMRRGQDKGANAGTRAALIGGADFTSNTGASYTLGLPPKGTHAHSMVQAFMALGEGEYGAFKAYADVYPDDCLLLVDTVDTLQSGIPNAIKVFEQLRKKGHKPLGIRLDSGDLAYLSIKAAQILNEAGFKEEKIFLSNQLDELVIWQIIEQIKNEAPRHGLDADHLVGRLAYGVGTRMIVSEGKPALDGVYKLTAVKDKNKWLPALKVSENPEKTINPGLKDVWRLYNERGKATADLLSLKDDDITKQKSMTLLHPTQASVKRTVERGQLSNIEPLLVDIIHDGKLKYTFPSLEQIRRKRDDDLDKLDPGVKRLINPNVYHVSLTEELWNLKQELVNSWKVKT
jgi:nicotinate phosphoribosyltransferase